MTEEKFYPSRVLKCPKCRRHYPDIIDLYINHAVTFCGNDSGYYDKGLLSIDDVYKQVAKCRYCGHQWTIRKTVDIKDVME